MDVSAILRRPITDVGLLEEWSQAATDLLAHEIRWKDLAQYGTVAYEESVLQHQIKTAYLVVHMLSLEDEHEGLDPFLLMVTAVMHDLGEGITSDKADRLRTDEEENAEASAYSRIVEGLPMGLWRTFNEAYEIANTKERTTRNQEFFRAVEIVGYLMRALTEVRAGNVQFVEPLFFHRPKVEKYRQMFSSFATVIDPVLDEMERYRRRYPEWDPTSPNFAGST